MKSVSPLVFSANLKTIINIPTLPLSKVLPPFSILLLTKIPATPILINTFSNVDTYILLLSNVLLLFSILFIPKPPPIRNKRTKHYNELGCHHMYSMSHWISQTFLCSWFWPLAKSKSLLNLLNFPYLGPAVGLARQE